MGSNSRIYCHLKSTSYLGIGRFNLRRGDHGLVAGFSSSRGTMVFSTSSGWSEQRLQSALSCLVQHKITRMMANRTEKKM